LIGWFKIIEEHSYILCTLWERRKWWEWLW